MAEQPACGREMVEAVLRRERPRRVVFAPNLWQWWNHHRSHGTRPEELAGCETQLDVLRHLGVDVFSRNIYADPRRCWFGGLSTELWDGVAVRLHERTEDRDLVCERSFITSAGTLRERQRYRHDGSTIVQERFAVEDPAAQLDAFEKLVRGRRWRFDAPRYQREQERAGDDGIIMAGELFGPLKLLHLALGPEGATYLLADRPRRAAAILAAHEEAQLDLVRQMTRAGVPAMIAMDNLDANFHPPDLIKRCSASFYERAAKICHERGSAFLIHACGRQRANLELVASLGVDGLEGVAAPPLGDVELDQALELTGDRFLITGGISAAETARLRSRAAVYRFVESLFERMSRHTHRWIFSSSCNTAIETPWETVLWLRDAWRELCGAATEERE